MTEDDDRYVPSIKEAFRNWKYSTLPFHKKAALTIKNEFKKVRTFKNCCGNIDEPGC